MSEATTGADKQPDEGVVPAGLYDGFEGYRTPTTDDYRRALEPEWWFPTQTSC